MRVVSLVPSATETLLAWGVDVVGCTRFCDQPDIAHVGGTKNPDIAHIVALAPELVVLDEEENRREDAVALEERGLHLHVTAVHGIDGLGEQLSELASAAGAATPHDLDSLASPGPASGEAPRRAFVPIWRRPWMSISADTYGGALLHRCGIELVTADAPQRYPAVELADIGAAAPDLVLLPSEPYVFEVAHETELAEVLAGVPIMRIDGRDLFWWGVRTPAALARLARALREAPRARLRPAR